MNKPAISCVCLTYGRTWLLAEAIESYLRQDYQGQSELIILNDFAGMTLEIDAETYGERIKIINLPKRMTSLNDKFDLGVKFAQYPLICMWDDDDISLPHRLSVSVGATWSPIANMIKYASFTHHYNLDAGKLPTVVARGIHGGDMFTKDCYMLLNGSSGDGHNDENFVAKVKADGLFSTFDNSSRPFYIYRWGGITAHHSCYARDVATCMQRFHRDVVRDRRFVTGRVRIVPAWAQDYQALCETVRNRIESSDIGRSTPLLGSSSI